MATLFGFKSFFNHNKNFNLAAVYLTDEIVKIATTHDIKAGEELTCDYINDVKDPVERNKRLEKYGF